MQERSEWQMEKEEISYVLKQYGLTPRFIETFGKVRRIYTDRGVFALKKITVRDGGEFIRRMQYLYQRGFNRIVPVFPTIDGRYGVLYDKYLYYLMPWLPNELKEDHDERHKQMFRELARLHALSAQEVPVDREERTQFYERTMKEWEKDGEFLDGFLEQCEQRTYMSPFELLYCLCYNDIRQALRFSVRKFSEWYEKVKDLEKGRMILVHGKISPEHFLYDERGFGFFSNFEESRLGSPLHDLLPFLSRIVQKYPKKYDECIDWLYTYFKFFPLREEEMSLFLSYFAYPGPAIRELEKIFHAARKNEYRNVQKLQRQYWRLKNIEYIVMRVDEIERQKKLEAELKKDGQYEDDGALAD